MYQQLPSIEFFPWYTDVLHRLMLMECLRVSGGELGGVEMERWVDELGIFDRECVKVDESVAEEGVSFQK